MAHFSCSKIFRPLAFTLAALGGVSSLGCGAGIGEDVGYMEDDHHHAEVSYEKIFRPVVESAAEGSLFGSAVKVGFDAVTEFARTDFAHHACLDTPDGWGLEISAGAQVGVGYFQGIEMAFEGGDINLNCLSQVQLTPQLEVGARVNLIRHFGECHAEGENLEDTLFIELGAGVDTAVEITLEAGVAYTAGLRKGLLNRTIPAYVTGSYDNWRGVIDAIVRGKPVFDPMPTAKDRSALCGAVSDVFDGEHNVLHAEDAVHAEKLNGFLRGYVEANTHCEGAVGDIVQHDDEHHDEHGDEHHDEDLHSWTVCTDVTLKSTVGVIRGEVARRRDKATGLMRGALGQLEVTVALLDDVFSGCDHIEFQLGAGVGAATPVTVSLGIESHNYYGTLSFDGSEDELGAVLAEVLDKNTFRDPRESSGWGDWFLGKACNLAAGVPGLGAFGVLPSGAICDMIRLSRATLGLVETLRNDSRFKAEFATSLELWGLALPLPNNALLNYSVNCSLGPARNVLELLWY